MKYTVRSACGCHMGKVRKNNEDNFYYLGRCLESENTGLRHPVSSEDLLKTNVCCAVFDGMGGESFGELASFAAARQMQLTERKLLDYFVPEKKYLQNLTKQLNEAVVETKKEMLTEHMGSTMVALNFSGHYVYVCNVGDSRAYRLRDGEFLQISEDHVVKLPGKENKKAPLSQYLGIDPDEMELEPHIAKGEIKHNDIYLICSDGLTDMLTNFEISDIMLNNEDPEICVQKLIDSALEHGGRDNITAIICRVD